MTQKGESVPTKVSREAMDLAYSWASVEWPIDDIAEQVLRLKAGFLKSRRQVKALKKHLLRKCVWTFDDVECGWDTQCGQKWVFTDGGPQENGAVYCCYCGGKIKEG